MTALSTIGEAAQAVRTKVENKVECVQNRIKPISESKLTTIMSHAYTTLLKIRTITRTVWNTQTAGTAFILSDITSRVFRIGVALYEKSKMIQYLAAQARLISLFSIPFALYNTCLYATKVAAKDDMVNSGIYFAQSLGWLADSALGVLNVLKAYPMVAQVAQFAVAPLMGVSLGSSVISFCWNGYGIYRNMQFLKNFDEFIAKQEEKEFKELFNIDSEKINDKMAKDKSAAENALRARIKSKIVSHKLCMLALAVAGVGMAILLASGGGAVAATVGAFGSVIYLAAMVYEIKAKGKLEAEFELPENPWQKRAMIIGTISLIAIPVLVTKNLL